MASLAYLNMHYLVPVFISVEDELRVVGWLQSTPISAIEVLANIFYEPENDDVFDIFRDCDCATLALPGTGSLNATRRNLF
jgi:hypothetical protein